MKRNMAALALAALAVTALMVPAIAGCGDDSCRAIETILKARSANFSAFKGKPDHDPHGLPIWDGKQSISGLIDSCYVYRRGETGNYEYHCDAGALGTRPLPRERAQKIVETLKAGIAAINPKIVWFIDPTSEKLAEVGGFEGSEAWYGGYSKDKLIVKVEIAGSPTEATVAGLRVFAKNFKRRDVK